jgi:hypothetical protein
MYSQSGFIQTTERAAIVDEWFRAYCGLLKRDSLANDDPVREQQLESAYDCKA